MRDDLVAEKAGASRLPGYRRADVLFREALLAPVPWKRRSDLEASSSIVDVRMPTIGSRKR